MRVIVLGAGVVGLCSAYALVARGHEVVVVDRGTAVGGGASYANGGQLSYSYVAPLAGPGVISSLPAWLLDRDDAPIRFKPRLDLHQWRWCAAFLLACSKSASRRTTTRLREIAEKSRAGLKRLTDAEPMEFGLRPSGKLTVHSDAGAFTKAYAQADFQNGLGDNLQVLDRQGCLDREPALALGALGERMVGGIYAADDETADCLLFCQQLARRLTENHGVSLLLDVTIAGLSVGKGRASHALTSRGALGADAFVIALGVGSRRLLKPHGVDLPVYPLRGYSLSIPISDPAGAPIVSVTDYASRVVFARLGRDLRVAGMVDIGTDERSDRERANTLRRQARGVFPRAGDFDEARVWGGFRPATPGGAPIIGRPKRLANVVLNVGHGALGFTLAVASGEMAADAIEQLPDVHRPPRAV
jgi:D-amino-acid dehydrogenase